MAWARRSLDHFRAHRDEVVWHEELGGRTQSLFGIVQGGMYRDLRRESAERLVEMDFDGYAIGGLSVGEPRELTLEMISEVLPLLPKDKPRYVMGVGYPDEIEQYARMGVDMMDCVLPTRAARHGLLFTSEGRLNIKGKRYAEDQGPPDPACDCMVCRRYSRAYLRHLMQAGEALSGTLNTIHNLAYYLGIMERVRESLDCQALNAFNRSGVDGCAEQLPERLHIFGQGLRGRLRHAVERLRLALHELLFDSHIAGFFQLEQLRAQVAVSGAGLCAQPGELRLFNPGKQGEQGQAQLPVNDRIELRQLRHGRPLARSRSPSVCAARQIIP